MSLRTRVGNMPRPAAPPSAAPASLRSRPPGYAAMEACLAERAASPRNALERLLGIAPLRRPARQLHDLALLEAETAAALAALPADWTVLHSVPLFTTVIPHLAMGPAGVFAIFPQLPRGAAAELVAGQLLVNGGATRVLDAVRRCAAEAQDVLAPVLPYGVSVAPVLAFVGPRRLTLRTGLTDVAVLDSAELVGWLRRLPEICSALQVDRMADGAESPATWGAQEGGGETLRHRSRFLRLQGEMDQADHRWMLTVRALVVAGLGVTVVSAAMVGALLGTLAR